MSRLSFVKSQTEIGIALRNCASQNVVESYKYTWLNFHSRGIPCRQEFQTIKHSLSFDEFALRNIKKTLIIVVYTIVRLYAPFHTRSLSSVLLPLLNETSFSTIHNRTLPPLTPDAKPPTNLSPSHHPRVRIIPYNYIRFGTTPSGLEIEIKLSCFYMDEREKERGKEKRTERDKRTRRRREIV